MSNHVDTKIVLQDDKMFVGRSQDCTPIVEFARAQQNAGFHGSSEMRHVARIPNVIIEKYLNDNDVTFEAFMADPAHMKRICNDPSLSAFRIWPGRI